MMRLIIDFTIPPTQAISIGQMMEAVRALCGQVHGDLEHCEILIFPPIDKKEAK